MINRELIAPESIVIIGGSNNTQKPGGKIIRNLLEGKFPGKLYAVNPKETEVQGIPCFPDITSLPNTELAILAVPAAACPSIVEELASTRNTKAFIIISAGFGEETHEGFLLEQEILKTANKYEASLIGPNCIGLMNRHHRSVFTLPIPELDSRGVDLISSSGATAVYIMESAIGKGLRFNSVWSVGNAPQIGVEDVLEYLDRTYIPGESTPIKILYIENIKDPDRMLLHASSLIRKGCKIAAIKSGSSESGSRAASSHTGAMASSDLAVEALFRKAGIVRCFSREELTTVACVFNLKEIKGRNFAIVTHAGGPAVMLTDALSKGGMHVPELSGEAAQKLKEELYPGASVGNPIDILATGTPEHLEKAIDFCENTPEIDAIAVIFGSPGLVKVYDAYDVLHRKMEECSKPIFPVLPSVVTAGKEVEYFLNKGHVNFSDEVALATAVARVFNASKPTNGGIELYGVNVPEIRRIIDDIGENGYLPHNHVQSLFSAAGIPIVPEIVSSSKEELLKKARQLDFPLVAKVVGPVHKSDIGGVVLNIQSEEHLAFEFDRMMKLPEVTAIMVQPMLQGKELFVGAKYEPHFGHVILCGLGGIFVEILRDVASGLAPLSENEALSMIRSLRAYKMFRGVRGEAPIDEIRFAEIIVRLSTLLRFATEIKEMDINPLLATKKGIIAVDARIRIEKEAKNK